MEELISVIIPVYNVEKYLDRCMQSVLMQTYQNLEIILVDDGSTDTSGKLCDEYAKNDKRVRVIHKENGGASSARNQALDIATGKYIGFVDADDWIAEDMYQYLHELLQRENADVAACNFTRNPREIEKGVKDEKLTNYNTERIWEFFYRVNGEISYYSIWNRLYKRSVLEQIRFIEGKTTEDVLFIYEVYKNIKKMAVSNQKKYLYFKNEIGVTRSKLCKKDYALLEIWDQIVDREKNTQYSKWADLNRKRATFTLYVKGILYGREQDIDKEVIKKWKRELKENYSILMQGRFLETKRKILLFLISKLV